MSLRRIREGLLADFNSYRMLRRDFIKTTSAAGAAFCLLTPENLLAFCEGDFSGLENSFVNPLRADGPWVVWHWPGLAAFHLERFRQPLSERILRPLSDMFILVPFGIPTAVFTPCNRL